MSRKRLILCLGACMLVAVAWPAAAQVDKSGNKIEVNVGSTQWSGGGWNAAVKLHDPVTLHVEVTLTGADSNWKHAYVRVGDSDWGDELTPAPNFTGAGPHSADFVFDPLNKLLGGEKDRSGVCGEWPVEVRVCGYWNHDTHCDSSSGVLTVELEDKDRPSIACEAMTVELEEESVELLAMDFLSWYNDDCGVVGAEVKREGGTAGPSLTFDCRDVQASPIAVKVRARDAAGHWSEWCALNVTVVDVDPPEFVSCENPAPFEADAGKCSSIQTIHAPPSADNCAVDPLLTEHRFTMIAGHPGFTNPSDPYYNYSLWTGGDVVVFDFPVGDSKIEWRVFDTNKPVPNVSEVCEQTITVKDTQVPTITAGPQGDSITKNYDTSYDNERCELGDYDDPVCGLSIHIFPPKVNDNCPPPQSQVDCRSCNGYRLWVEVPRLAGTSKLCFPPTCYPIGVTELFWYAEDAAGNKSLAYKQTVTITSTLHPPTIENCQDHLVCASFGECEGYVDICPPHVWDCCPPWIDPDNHGQNALVVTHTAMYPDGTVGDAIVGMDASGTYPVGTTTILWDVVNPSKPNGSNSDSCVQTITVKDCEPPRLCCCDVCGNTPTVYTYDQEYEITAADLIAQMRGPLGFFPYQWHPSECHPGTNNCKGWISDNCDGADSLKLVIVTFDTATHKWTEVAGDHLYSVSEPHKTISFMAKDSAGNYSCPADVCTLQIDLDVGTGAPMGACCVADGPCQMLTHQVCYAKGGEYQGDGTNCTSYPCKRACCFSDGTCKTLTWADCYDQGGWFHFTETSCASNPCPQLGACCFTDGPCQVLLPMDCSYQGGHYQGPNTTCDPNPCPKGVCCFADGSCHLLTLYECEAEENGVFHGVGTTCDQNWCPKGACCFSDDRYCLIRIESACISEGGTYKGDGTTCTTGLCPRPTPPAPLDKASDVTTSTENTTVPTAVPFSFCGGHMAVASMLSLFCLIGVKLTWRRRR